MYSWFVGSFLNDYRASAEAGLQEVLDHQNFDFLPRGVVHAAAELWFSARHLVGSGPSFAGKGDLDAMIFPNGVVVPSAPDLSVVGDGMRLSGMLRPELKRVEGEHEIGERLVWTIVEGRVFRLEQAIADEVLAAHATGTAPASVTSFVT